MKVKAKRAGWDQTDGLVTDTDEHDPPAWVDAGLPPEIEGELVEYDVPATKYVRAHKVCLVAGEPVDPATIEPA